MKDNRPALIWRKTMYFNNFECSCGHVCFKDGKVADDMLFDPEEQMLVCPKCYRYVAQVSTVDAAIRSGARQGAEA